MILVSVCLSDIPKDKIKKAENGKCYCNIVVDARKEPDKYENTHTVYMSMTKEERESKDGKVYVGNGKEIVFQSSSPSTPSHVENLPTAPEYDLPF